MNGEQDGGFCGGGFDGTGGVPRGGGGYSGFCSGDNWQYPMSGGGGSSFLPDEISLILERISIILFYFLF